MRDRSLSDGPGSVADPLLGDWSVVKGELPAGAFSPTKIRCPRRSAAASSIAGAVVDSKSATRAPESSRT
jgi:hypothetical protein